MPESNSTSAGAQSLGVQENAIVQKFKDFFISLLKWSLALIGAKDFLGNKQAIFVAISIAVAMLFVISWQTARSDREKTFIGFAFLVLGYAIVGIAIDWVVPNSYNKWVIYSMFLATVTTCPDHRHIFQKMREIFMPMCKETYSKLKNLFIQSREESSMNNNHATQAVRNAGGEVGDGENNA